MVLLSSCYWVITSSSSSCEHPPSWAFIFFYSHIEQILGTHRVSWEAWVWPVPAPEEFSAHSKGFWLALCGQRTVIDYREERTTKTCLLKSSFLAWETDSPLDNKKVWKEVGGSRSGCGKCGLGVGRADLDFPEVLLLNPISLWPVWDTVSEPSSLQLGRKALNGRRCGKV